MKRQYWMHRTCGGDKASPFAKPLLFSDRENNEGYITIGWSDFSTDAFAKDVRERGLVAIKSQYKESGWDLKKNISCLNLFLHDIHKGDIVLVPTDGTFSICEVLDDCILSNESFPVEKLIDENGRNAYSENGYIYNTDGQQIDMGFYRKVRLLFVDTPRRDASPNIIRRMKVPKTNNQCNDIDGEIEALMAELQSEKEIQIEITAMNEVLNFGNVIDDYAEKTVEDLDLDNKCIRELPFSSFRIPEYQRSYKWQTRNVNQLINDIITFKKGSSYRLGTLVLHNSDIVDGQQRIVTISLIIAELQRIHSIAENPLYQPIFKSVNSFLKRTEYADPSARQNVVNNIAAIRERREDFDAEFAEALFEKCSFTIVRLPSIPEAFQFFDSQNARGKDLAPHDLLKAFHLREVGTDDDIKKEKVEGLIEQWQDIKTSDLIELFLCLYRIRQWSKGNSARAFDKEDIAVFKGITARTGKTIYPSYKPSYILKLLLELYQSKDSEGKQKPVEYPYQIDGVILNGKTFFDMILRYHQMLKDIRNCDSSYYKNSDRTSKRSAYDIIKRLSNYDQMYRTGDGYTRELFDAALLYYIDKFGCENIDKVAAKIFTSVYGTRLHKYKVTLAGIDDEALKYGNLFKAIRDASKPEDFLNLFVPPISSHQDNCSQDLLKMYNRIKLIG